MVDTMGTTPDETLLPVLGAALDQTRSAACITTADLDLPGPTIVYVNPAYCEMTGHTAEEVVGQTPRIMQGPLTDRRVLDRLRGDLVAGRPFVGEAVNYRKDGSPFLISWRIDPVVDTEGNTTHYIATQDDITRLRRAERLLGAEQAIDRSVSTLLSGTGTPTRNLTRLAADIATAVVTLADYGEVAVSGSIRLGTSEVVFSAGADQPEDDSHTALIEAAGGRAVSGGGGDDCWIGCSLVVRRAGIEGAIMVRGLDQDELAVLDGAGLERVTECARRALDSLAEYERQRLVAIELQRDLLPAATPEVAGLGLSARYQPGAFATRIGGDWYDIVDDGGRVVLIVGDIAGSGVRAAADMGRVRLLTRVLLQQGADLDEVFAAVNRFCSDEDLMATALAVIVEPGRGSIEAVSAGHLPPIVRTAAGAAPADVRPGPLLGIGGQPTYPVNRLVADEGDVVLMFTDGLIERPGQLIDDSIDELAAGLAALPDDTEQLCATLIERRLADSPGDDIAVLAARLRFKPAAGRGSAGT